MHVNQGSQGFLDLKPGLSSHNSIAAVLKNLLQTATPWDLKIVLEVRLSTATESKDGGHLKGPLETILSNPPGEAGSPRAGSTGS